MKRQPLSFKNGLTNNPSDLVCSDDSLALNVGMEFDGSSHKPIQHPLVIAEDFRNEIVTIHDFANYTHIIFLEPAGGDNGVYIGSPILPTLGWCDLSDPDSVNTICDFEHEILGAQTIGNTVILNTDDGLYYLLWKNDTEGYKVLGNQLPEMGAQMKMTDGKFYKYTEDGFGEYELVLPGVSRDGFVYTITDRPSFEDAVIGVISAGENKVKRDGHFPYPFFGRLAYRLYDGSYAGITSPQLMLPTVRYNINIIPVSPDFPATITYKPYACDLKVTVDEDSLSDMSDWADIISGIDVFVTNDVRGFDMESDHEIISSPDSSTVYADFVSGTQYGTNTDFGNDPSFRIKPEQKTDANIIQELINSSVYYKICELSVDDFTAAYDDNEALGWVNVSNKLQKHTLENLTTQTQLEHDDFFGHCKMAADSIMTYNGRLHMANLKRGFFSGFEHHIPMEDSTSRTADVYVEIEAQSGTRIVHHQIKDERLGYWYYHPDPRAKKAYVILGGSKYTLTMKQHPFLNGSYYFGALPSSNADNLPTADADNTAPTVSDGMEVLANQIITSEVNNPFVFNVDGANDVGSGRILVITTNTRALSEGQFGQHPLIAFTDEGIWALTVDSEGLYSSVIPLSREVCSNIRSVTQTDSAIFFVTKRGLMVLVGAKVQCVSDLMNGKDNDLYSFLHYGETAPSTALRTVLQNGNIAYDYKNQRLWMWHSGTVFTFNIGSRTFAQYETSDTWLNDYILYPDSIIQTESGNLLSLIGTPDINDDENGYASTMISRPLKFGDALAYKTLFRIQHMWLADGTMTMEMYGSDDVRNWQRLEALHGKPWKFYTFRLDFTDMKATDTYNGMVVEYQARHTGRMNPETDIDTTQYTPL